MISINDIENDIYIYIIIYIYEPDTFRVYITTVCCLQYIMESKM